jgi:hypothetical protein
MFKLIYILDGLIQRPIIQQHFTGNYARLAKYVENDLDDAKLLFDRQRTLQRSHGCIQLDRNMPRVAGSLLWAEKFMQRYTKPTKQFQALEHT